MLDVQRAGELAAAASERASLLVAALRRLDEGGLRAPSRLPEWDRLTVVCHLRYGTAAFLRMTRDTLAGRPASFYPEGRFAQRPGTLVPQPGERAADVVESLAATSAELDGLWAGLGPDDWARQVVEPADNPDLGAIPLGRLAMSRLTELDVHGTDLDVGHPDWSPVLVEVALPTRLGWLATRRSNHKAVDRSVQGSWLLVASDGPTWRVAVDGDRVESRPAEPGEAADAVIEGSSRDLLAMLLGRPPNEPLRHGGDVALAAAFPRAFPGP